MTHFSWTTSSLTKTVFTGNHIQISSEVHRFKVHSWKNFNKLENTVSILVKFTGHRLKDAAVIFLSGHLTAQSWKLSYPLMNRSVWFQNFVKRIKKSFLKIEVEMRNFKWEKIIFEIITQSMKNSHLDQLRKTYHIHHHKH